MSTDRQLLEAAAKAVGIEPHVVEAGGMLYVTTEQAPLGIWAPLTDDGDALRLGVRLKMGIHFESQFLFGREERIVEVYSDHRPDGGCTCTTEEYTDDPFGALRRAIVRAAASMAPQPALAAKTQEGQEQ